MFLVGVCADEVPAHPQPRRCGPTRLDLLPTPAARRPPRPAGAPRPRPRPALGAGSRRTPRSTRPREELRLGYVAFTRAAAPLVVSSYLWAEGRAGAARALAVPGDRARRDRRAGAACRWPGRTSRRRAPPTRCASRRVELAVAGGRADRRGAAPARRGRARGRGPRPAAAAPDAADDGLDLVEQARVAEWDDELDRLVAEARRDRAQVVEVPLPASPVGDHARAAARRPRRRSPTTWPGRCRGRPSPAARFGTRVPRLGRGSGSGSRRCSSPTRSPGRGDDDIDDYADLRELIATFEAGPFADPGAARRRGAVRAGARRPGGARPDRRGLRRARRRLPPGRLEDQPAPRRPTRSSSRSTGWPGPS